MFKTLKYTAMAAALALTPLSASALSFGGDINPGDTYNFTDGQQRLVAVAIGDTPAGSFSFDVTNDASSTWTFQFGIPFFNLTFPDGAITFGTEVVDATAPFTVALAAGETRTVTVSYGDSTGGDRIGARFSAVPLPAGLVLLLSALGLTALMRKRSAAVA